MGLSRCEFINNIKIKKNVNEMRTHHEIGVISISTIQRKLRKDFRLMNRFMVPQSR